MKPNFLYVRTPMFKDDVSRSNSLHADAVMETLVKMYGAHRIAKELRQ